MYRDRISNLHSFVAVEWDGDTVMYPRGSQVFDQVSKRGGKTPQDNLIYRDFEIRLEPKNYDLEKWEKNERLRYEYLIKL